MNVTARLLDGPTTPDDQWEDIVEVSFGCEGGVAIGDLLNPGDEVVLADRPGSYRLRISARGRDAGHAQALQGLEDGRSDQEATQILETYLIEAWQAPPATAAVVRLTSRYDATLLAPNARYSSSTNHADAQISAAQAISRDIDRRTGARTLSGQLGTATTRATLLGTQRRYYKLFVHLYGWWGHVLHSGDAQVGLECWLLGNERRPEHAVMGEHGAIQVVWVELTPPRLVTATWNWMVNPTPGKVVSVDLKHPLLADPSTLRFDLAQETTGTGAPATTVAVEHRGIPMEWVQDMVSFWRGYLAGAENVYALNYR